MPQEGEVISVNNEHLTATVSYNNSQAGLVAIESWGTKNALTTIPSISIQNSSLNSSVFSVVGALYLESGLKLDVAGDNPTDGNVLIESFTGTSNSDIGAVAIYGGWLAAPGEEKTGTRLRASNLTIRTITGNNTAGKSISGIHMMSGGEVDIAEKTEITTVTGNYDAFGIQMEGHDRYLRPTVFQTSQLTVSGITANNGKALGVSVSYGSVDITGTDDAIIRNISATNGMAVGFETKVMNGDANRAEDDLVYRGAEVESAGNLFVSNISSSLSEGTDVKAEAYGVKAEGTTFTGRAVVVSDVQSDGNAFGIHQRGGSMTLSHVGIRNVSGQTGSMSVLLDVSGYKNEYDEAKANFAKTAEFTAENSVLDMVDDADSGIPVYHGAFAEDYSSSNEVSSIAIRATSEGSVNLNTGIHQIEGSIVAGYGSVPGENAVSGGTIEISGSSVQIAGDVYAGNRGSITIDLNGESSWLEGQIDDYHELAFTDTAFRNSLFKNDTGNALDVTQAGQVKLNLNGSTWIARGQNFVDTVSFGTNGGMIDLSRNENSSATIENLTGSGTFVMELGAYSESGVIKTDMLYIQNAEAGSQHVIHAKLGEGVTRDDLKNIRFATVKNGASDNLLVVKVEDQGAFNLTATVEQEDYQVGDADNERFNGTNNGEGDYKPGEDVVDAIFGAEESASTQNAATLAETEDGASQNYFISGFSEGTGGSGLSDAGQTILATARATYWNAVILDRFNQRYGDRVYDQNRNGVWARVKHEHIGTDAGVGDFSSDNTTYQFGYDYTKPTENGKMIWGGAIDYMNGRTDYKSINGDGGTDRIGALLYATYLADNGAYTDLVLRAGRLSADYEMSTPSGTHLDADYDHWMYGISFEAGHQLENSSGWFVEPQLQAQYTRITDGDYHNQQTRVEQDAIDSLITRAGFRVGKFLSDNKATLGYFKADVMHEWMGEQDIRVYDVTTAAEGADVSLNNHGTWFDVGGGFQAAVTQDLYAYGDVEYRFGNDFDNTWIINIGAKYRF